MRAPQERGIPFLIYSGFDTVGGAAADGVLVAAMEGLIRGAFISDERTAAGPAL